MADVQLNNLEEDVFTDSRNSGSSKKTVHDYVSELKTHTQWANNLGLSFFVLFMIEIASIPYAAYFFVSNTKKITRGYSSFSIEPEIIENMVVYTIYFIFTTFLLIATLHMKSIIHRLISEISDEIGWYNDENTNFKINSKASIDLRILISHAKNAGNFGIFRIYARKYLFFIFNFLIWAAVIASQLYLYAII